MQKVPSKQTAGWPLTQISTFFRHFVLVIIALAWITGIWQAELWHIEPIIALGSAMIALLATVLFWQNRTRRLICLALISLCLGAWRYSISSPVYDLQSVRHFVGDKAVQISGEVVEMPKVSQRSRLLTIEVSSIQRDRAERRQNIQGRIAVLVLGTELEDPYGANYGDQVRLYGTLQLPQPYHAENIQASMTFPAVHVTASGGNIAIKAIYSLRVRLAQMLEQILPQPAAAVLIGIVLGLHTPGLKPLQDIFRDTGTTHLLVTSGSTITLLASLITACTRHIYTPRKDLLPAEKSRDWRNWLITAFVIFCIISYTILSGAGVAAIRAGIMAVVLAIAPHLGRHYNIYTALAFTLLMMSIIDPFVIWDTGFQLSFLSTVSIVLFTPSLQNPLRWLRRFPGGSILVENVAVTLSAQIGILPILVLRFQNISLVSPLANMLVIPCVEALLLIGLFTCLIGLFFFPFALLCGWVCWPLLWYMINAITWCADLPLATLPIHGVDDIITGGYYGMLGIAAWITSSKHAAQPQSEPSLFPMFKLSRRSRLLLQIGFPLLTIVLTGFNILNPLPASSQTTITFLPVGPWQGSLQGQAILIQTAGKTVLIDGGPDAITLGEVLDRQFPSWQRTLDIVILTSPHRDHIQGLHDTVSRYQITSVIDGGMLHPTTTYAHWRRTIKERGLSYQAVSQGDSIHLSNATTLQVLWPPPQLYKGTDETRANGLILRLITPGLRLLLLGTSAQNEYAMAGLVNLSTQALSADIVQAIGNTNGPASQEFVDVLQKVQPSLLVFTPAAQKAKSLPSASTDSQIPELLAHEQMLSTAHMGELEIISNQQGWRVQITDAAR